MEEINIDLMLGGLILLSLLEVWLGTGARSVRIAGLVLACLAFSSFFWTVRAPIDPGFHFHMTNVLCLLAVAAGFAMIARSVRNAAARAQQGAS